MSASLQVILIYSCSVNSFNLGVPVGGGELRVFLLCRLGHSPPNYLVFYNRYFRAFLAICAIRLRLRLIVVGTRLLGNSLFPDSRISRTEGCAELLKVQNVLWQMQKSP